MELIDLTLIWVLLIGFGVFMYVLMDGFDLGVGILFPFAPSDESRDEMMNSVAPVWDGNETWLILGGAGLLAAFPMIYSVFLPALYIGVFLLLAGLIFRGIAFEFRFKATTQKHWWDYAFFGGSTVASFAQGAVIGSYVQGFNVVDGRYVGGAFDWLTPFTLMTGLGVVAGYALLGVTWTIMKTEGKTQDWAFKLAPSLLVIVLGFFVLVSVWTPLTNARVMTRWFDHVNWLWIFPALTVAFAACGLRAAQETGRDLAVPRLDDAVLDVLPRHPHLHVAAGRAARLHVLGRRFRSGQPAVPADRFPVPDPHRARLHRVDLLGVSRQGEAWGRIRWPLRRDPVTTAG
jgi:cytochrome bd ubiquinol oxidase subunit II